MAINNFNVGVGTTSQLTRYRYVATGGETSISGTDADGKTLSYTVGLEQVFLNGVNLVRGQDYTATNGTSIGNLTALVASDSLEVFAYVPFNIANALTVSTVDAKGDLLVGTGADTVGRLAVGTDGQLLSAASGETSGLKWANANGLAFIGTTSWSAVGSVTLSLGTSYSHFRLVVSHTGSSVDSDALLRVSLNGTPSTAVQYNSAVLGLTNANSTTNLTGTLSSYKYATNETASANEYGGFVIDLIDLNVARFTKITSIGTQVSSAGAVTTFTGATLHDIATAYNEVVLLTSTGTFTGRASIYGYNS